MSCSEKEDENKIAILKAAQDELITEIKIQENQNKTKFASIVSAEPYYNISTLLNSLILSTIDLNKMRNGDTINYSKLNKSYKNIIDSVIHATRYKLYLPADSTIIYQTISFTGNQKNNGNKEEALLNNINILTKHLKILRINSYSSTGCWLGIRNIGYGNTNVIQFDDSTKIIFSFKFHPRVASIEKMNYKGLYDENNNEIKGVKYTIDEKTNITITSKTIKKGKYYGLLNYDLILDTGDQKRNEIVRVPITVW